MKTISHVLCFGLLVFGATVEGRVITVTLNPNPAVGPTNNVAEVSIQTNEVATIRFITVSPFGGPGVNLLKNNVEIPVPSGAVFAGPALIRFVVGNDPGICTVEI